MYLWLCIYHAIWPYFFWLYRTFLIVQNIVDIKLYICMLVMHFVEQLWRTYPHWEEGSLSSLHITWVELENAHTNIHSVPHRMIWQSRYVLSDSGDFLHCILHQYWYIGFVTQEYIFYSFKKWRSKTCLILKLNNYVA